MREANASRHLFFCFPCLSFPDPAFFSLSLPFSFPFLRLRKDRDGSDALPRNYKYWFVCFFFLQTFSLLLSSYNNTSYPNSLHPLAEALSFLSTQQPQIQSKNNNKKMGANSTEDEEEVITAVSTHSVQQADTCLFVHTTGIRSITDSPAGALFVLGDEGSQHIITIAPSTRSTYEARSNPNEVNFS